MPFLLSSAHDWSSRHSLASCGSMEGGWAFIGQGEVKEQVMDSRIDGAPSLCCCWVLSVEVLKKSRQNSVNFNLAHLKMSLDGMQRSVVQFLLETC